MPSRPMLLVAALATALALSACGGAGAAEPTPDLDSTDAATMPAEPMPTESIAAAPDPTPGTTLDACEVMTAADIEAALNLEAGSVDDGEVTEAPTVLSPGRSLCKYAGDWGGLNVELIPEDGPNLYDAARGAYDDAKDLEVGGDSAFYSAQNNRFFILRGSVSVMVTIAFISSDTDREALAQTIGEEIAARIS